MVEINTVRSRQLVRMYSSEVSVRLPEGSPAYAIGQILSEEVESRDHEKHPWRKFFEAGDFSEDPLTKTIAIEGAKLRNKWLHFRHNCAEEDQLDLERYEPSIESVFDMLNDAKTLWETRRKKGVAGKIITQFHKLSGHLQSHSALLKVLPEGSEYVSLFTGTLNIIIKASVNHERVAEGLSESLLIISQSITACNLDLEMFKTPIVMQHVSELYGLIFLFFSTFLDWFVKKRRCRILDSFNENIVQRFEMEIKSISQKATFIRTLVEQGSRAEIRDMRFGVDRIQGGVCDIQRDIRIGLEGAARDRAELAYYAAKLDEELHHSKEERKQNKQLLAQLINMLRENGVDFLRDRPIREYSGLTQGNASQAEPRFLLEATYDPSAPAEWTADDLALHSAHLEDFFHRDRVRLPYEASGPIRASHQILQHMADWTASQGAAPTMLWLSGAQIDADDLENPLSVIASHFIDLASRAKVPLLSYFCELRRGERLRAGNSSIETQNVLALVYSLIRQAVENLLPVFESNCDFSQERFQLIDGTTNSWDEAISIFRDLLGLMPDKVFCVIDGLHWVDHRDSKILVHDLLRVLRHDKLKVLWTTTGRVPSLLEGLDASEVRMLNRLDVLRESGSLYEGLFERG